MPRAKVKDENRRRVARACDNCKRRKEKCCGSLPCNLCRRRNCEIECVYTDIPSRLLSAQQQHQRKSVELNDEAATSSEAELAVESLLTLSGTQNTTRPAADGEDLAPVPKLARLLRDGLGKFMFVGDSSNLAFLQTIRVLTKTHIGHCALTDDPLRHAMIESTSVVHTPPSDPSAFLKPSRQDAKELVRLYLLATSGVIDLFNPCDITKHLMAWIDDASPDTDLHSSIYYLVLAIGAQALANDHSDQLAESYFVRGRQLVGSNLNDEPSTLMIQSCCLITLYMLIACRRNGAFMLLGIAIRAAYCLGLHRSDITPLFETAERQTRDRVWKSLRVLDLYMSASLGRPPGTSEVDGGHVSWQKPSRDYEDIEIGILSSSAMLRICFIFERILNEVYCRREVSVQLVESISRQYRNWTLELRETLQTDGLDTRFDSPDAALQRTIGLAHLKGAYYYSLCLLTRPFLVFQVSSHLKGEYDRVGSAVQTFADACVDSALRGLEIATDLIHTPYVPKRLPLVVNSVLVSLLVFGVACFGDFDKTFPLRSSLDQAITILAHFGKHDLSARRYTQIAKHLLEAVNEYIRGRDGKEMAKRRQDVSELFGNILAAGSSSHGKTNSEAPPTPDSASTAQLQNPAATPQLMPGFGVSDPSPFADSPVLTTSGALAAPDGSERCGVEENAMPAYGAVDFMESIPGIPSCAEEFPLFSLLSDFDPMNEQFSDFPG